MHESESESEAAQLCPTLLDPKDCSPPGSSVHGIFQAGGLERAATAFSAINMQCLSNTIAITITTRGFPGGAVVKNPPANAGDGGPISGWGDPLEEGTAAAPLFLPGEFHEWRNLAGYHPWGNKESDTTEHAHTHTPSAAVDPSSPLLPNDLLCTFQLYFRETASYPMFGVRQWWGQLVRGRIRQKPGAGSRGSWVARSQVKTGGE